MTLLGILLTAWTPFASLSLTRALERAPFEVQHLPEVSAQLGPKTGPDQDPLLNGCGSKNRNSKMEFWWKHGPKSALPLLFNFEPHPNKVTIPHP